MTATITNEHLRKELDNFERTGDMENLIEELHHSTLLIPVINGESPLIEIKNQTYLPLFTDVHEFSKLNIKGDFTLTALDFNCYLELLKDGAPEFIINIESERFLITRDFLDFMDTNYVFDYDPQVFTSSEISRIRESVKNEEFEEFLNDECCHWDVEKLLQILQKSDLFTVIVSKGDLANKEENGVISLQCTDGLLNYRTRDNFAVVFSREDKINFTKINGFHFYSQLVNLPLFIEEVLKGDLEGMILI